MPSDLMGVWLFVPGVMDHMISQCHYTVIQPINTDYSKRDFTVIQYGEGVILRYEDYRAKVWMAQ